jgi:SAM-dependent methyltransferase
MDLMEKAALRGEPSYIWREGQDRRLQMIRDGAAGRENGKVLVDGCGMGAYLGRLVETATQAVGLDIEWERAKEARLKAPLTLTAAGEYLPFPEITFDLVLSHEVLEHVQNDRFAIKEIVRTLRPGGRLILFCPNKGYPFETHGIYWKGVYHFGNIPFVNYFPRHIRDSLAPHVRVYTHRDLMRLFQGQPVKIISQMIIFGAYDNIIARHPILGRILRSLLQKLERTPLRYFGLSHFWVVERV